MVLMKKCMVRFLRIGIVSSLLFAGSAVAVFAAPVAPSFSAVALEGKPVASNELAGKAYIVNFFASWCPPCRAEIPDMVALQTKYARKGFTFIGVAVNETEPTMRAFIKKNKINYPVVMVDDKLMGSFNPLVDGGVRAIPTSFVINASGNVTQVITGGRSKAVLEKIILESLGKSATSK